MESRYERIKVIATDELRENFTPPKLLLKLILEIHHEVNYYNTSYKQAFLRLALYTPNLLLSNICRLGVYPNESVSWETLYVLTRTLNFKTQLKIEIFAAVYQLW